MYVLQNNQCFTRKRIGFQYLMRDQHMKNNLNGKIISTTIDILFIDILFLDNYWTGDCVQFGGPGIAPPRVEPLITLLIWMCLLLVCTRAVVHTSSYERHLCWSYDDTSVRRVFKRSTRGVITSILHVCEAEPSLQVICVRVLSMWVDGYKEKYRT